MKRNYAITLLILLLCISCFAQEDEVPEAPIDYSLPFPKWIDGLKKGKISGWLYYSEDENTDLDGRLASSSLRDLPPSNISDGNRYTAWSEGVAGPGIGQVTYINADATVPLWIWAGYGKSQELFLANNRPKKIKVYLLGTFCHDCTPVVCITGNFAVINSIEVTLQDKNDFQPLAIPALRIVDNTADCNGMGGHDTDKEHYSYTIAIEILSVYKGTKYDDTCISEVMDKYNYDNWKKRNEK